MIHRIGLPLCHDHPNSLGSIPNTAWDSSCGCIYRQSRPNDSTGSAVQSPCHVLYHTERLHCGHVLRNDGTLFTFIRNYTSSLSPTSLYLCRITWVSPSQERRRIQYLLQIRIYLHRIWIRSSTAHERPIGFQGCLPSARLSCVPSDGGCSLRSLRSPCRIVSS